MSDTPKPNYCKNCKHKSGDHCMASELVHSYVCGTVLPDRCIWKRVSKPHCEDFEQRLPFWQRVRAMWFLDY